MEQGSLHPSPICRPPSASKLLDGHAQGVPGLQHVEQQEWRQIFFKFKIYDNPRRNDSQGSNSTQSTNTWRMSRSIVSGDFNNSIARTGSGYSDKFSALTQVTCDFLNIRLLIWKIQKRGSTRSPLGIKKQNSSSQLVRLRFFSSESLKILDPHSLR